LLDRITCHEIEGFTATHILTEAAHRLMTAEASRKFGWKSKTVNHLKRQPNCIQQLNDFRAAIEDVPLLGIQVLAVAPRWVAAAAGLRVQHGLLSNDALTLAVMQQFGLSNIASHDADFDRVPGIARYAPT
jgi:predicted nucleic acid-binding protein